MPDSGTWVCNLVTHEPNAIVSWVRFDLVQGSAGAGPGRDSRPPPNRVANRGEIEVRCSGHCELAIGDVVIHVALAGMILAPGVFMRGNILGFAEVRCALIKVLI
jgi:hypothetical protein